ncbi:lysophosphatidylcholine acyltransferase 3 protein nessy [Brevipalpus obovatus]|uniref:lysophosphatidylcholine acyltransferase 3 protein nessy n=1 Tax=Brevipalpus obovatus TaxID=246614 RepID=UPI003D9F64FD
MFKLLSDKLSVPEAALTILVSILGSYVIAIIYNIFLVKHKVLFKQLFFIISGIGLGYLNHGADVLHTTATILGTYVILIILKGSREAVGAVFVYCLGYLLYGYMKTQGSDYNFEWTIPECILTLRLTAIAFDVYDGYRIKRGQKIAPNECALEEVPSVLDLLSASYLPFTFLVGPQFELKRFQAFLKQKDNLLEISFEPGIRRLFLALSYLIAYAIGNAYVPITAMETEQFMTSSFFWKFTVIAICTKVQCCKYIGIWLLSEGSLIVSGFTYNKKEKKLDNYSNVDVRLFELATTFGDIIRSFNLTTNNWAAKYLFKRLKFLGNRVASHALTLAFLAIWHGWMSGYYITFIMEFIIMKFEWEILEIVKRIRANKPILDHFMSLTIVRWSLLIFFRFYTIYMFGYCLVSFNLLSFERWYPVLGSVYFAGHVIYLSWIPLSPIIHNLVAPLTGERQKKVN